MLILNDIHIGAQRKVGTTPASQEALRSYLFDHFGDTVKACTEDHILVLGDLFDEFEVSPRDWVQTYEVFASWLTSYQDRKLTLVAGNHDHSPKALRVSSFEMLASVLLHQFRERVTVVGIDESVLAADTMALAHCSNQDIFDRALTEMLAAVKPGMHVLLHANYNNHFAAQSDHSLNVSEEQALKFLDLGATLVFAHEHQARTLFKGAAAGMSTISEGPSLVVVLGNQWPTSVSDCLGNDEKYAHTLNGGRLEKLVTWTREQEFGGYREVDWRDVKEDMGGGFVRVQGDATSGEAGDVINAIARFRQRSSALVITNAVKIDGIVESEALPESFEVAKRFDVMSFIQQNLEPLEYAAVLALMGEQVTQTQFE